MKRKPKMRVKIDCGKCKNVEIVTVCGVELYRCQFEPDTLFTQYPDTCGNFSAKDGVELEETFDEDAKGNWFCINCKWYAGGTDDGGECMFNPPVFVSDMGIIRPVTYPYDYCSRWEKEGLK